MSLPAFSVRQVVLVNLVFIIVLIAGVQTSRRIPVDMFPDISFNTALISTLWVGASPEEVERLLTKKLEDEINSISGIKEMISVSGDGLSEIYIEWQESLSEMEYQAALNDLRGAIDRASELPDDAEEPILRELSVSEAYNVLMVAVTDVGGVGEFAQREVARDLKDRLERIPGLRRADLRGERERELRVLVDEQRALQYDLTLEEINDLIAENNQNFASGSFTDRGSQEISVRGIGDFESAASLGAMVVKKNRGGIHVLLSDVAEVVDTFEDRRMAGRYNGHPAILIGISKEGGTAIVELSQPVESYVDEYRSSVPQGLELNLTWNVAEFVDFRLDMMKSNLVIGVVFVIFVLWLSVGFRNAMLAIVGVPFSFLAAMVLFPYFDITINSLSIIGFVMVSGMLVDDAIIILENIYRHIEEGVPLKEAAVRGAEEVMWPVIAAVATTMAAFIPMLLITGPSGEFMSILPKTVIVCLLGSLFEALIVLPAHYVDFGSRHKASDPRVGNSSIRLIRVSHRARLAVDRAIDRWRSRYLQAQAQVLEHRWSFVGVSLAALFFAVSLSSHVGVDLFPSDFNMVIVTVDGPPDSGIEQMEETMQGMEDSLESVRDELTDVMGFVGFSVDSEDNPRFGENLGVLYLTFPNNRKNAADPDRVLNLVRARVEHYRDANSERVVALRVVPPRNGPPIGTPVAIRIQSENYAVAKEIADEMKAELASTPGVFNIDDNLSLGPRELRVTLHPHRASIHGLAFEDVGVALMAANEGLVSSTFKDQVTGEDVDIRVLLKEDQRRSISDLLDVSIRTPDGYRVKLGDVAKIEIERGYEEFYHYDAQRAVVVYAEVDNEQATSLSVNNEMEQKFSDLSLRYSGVDVVYGGEFQMTDDSFGQMRKAFILALIAIYGILAAQFRSYVQPILVMSVIGFSFIGVIIGIYLLDYSLSMFVIYAMVGLAGIVVNDSLVLIDFINSERARGASAIDAIQTASGKRFRPILLTTVTTVAGLLPMALGISGQSVVYGPFAAAIVFGLSVASILTLFLVPSLYLSLEKASESMRARLASRKPKSDPAQASLV